MKATVNAIVEAAMRKVEAYRQENNGDDPPPSAVFLMHPDTVDDLRLQTARGPFRADRRPELTLLLIPVVERRFIKPGEIELAPRKLGKTRPVPQS